MRALLLAAAGGSGAFTVPPVTELPIDWGITRHADNPLLTVTMGEPNEMYTPAAVELPNGDIVVYVKGAARIYVWISTDGGATFDFMVGGAHVIYPVAATWESDFVVEPAALYDEDTDLIHVWYKARAAAADSWGWGHATAPGSNAADVTKDPANPILTSNAVEADLGSSNITDLTIGCVVRGPDGTFHFYGAALYDGIYHLIHGTGTTFNDPGDFEVILDAPGGSVTVVQCPDVFRVPGPGSPLYAMFYAIGEDQPGPRTIRVGTSTDLSTWDFSDTTDILSPTGTGWEEDETYCGHLIKENASPWLAPKLDGMGRWRYFYSGLEDSIARAGLAYMEPT